MTLLLELALTALSVVALLHACALVELLIRLWERLTGR